MSYLFVKLLEEAFATVNGGIGFKKLTLKSDTEIDGEIESDFLPPGIYTITVTAVATGLTESSISNSLTCKVK